MSAPPNGVFVSTSCLREPGDLLARVDRLAEHGFGAIELGSAEVCHESTFAALESRRLSFLVHNYFPAPRDPITLNLASADSRVLAASRALCRRAVELSARLGAPFYSVHAGLRAEVDPTTFGKPLAHGPIEPYDEAYVRFVESLRELCLHGQRHRVAIAVEPHVIAGFNLVNGRNELALMCESSELQRLFDDVGAENLGVLVDVGHLRVTSRTLGFDRRRFIDDVAERVLAFHVHDNNGIEDQHRTFDGDAWFLPILARFPAAPCILECHADEPDELHRCALLIGDRRRS